MLNKLILKFKSNLVIRVIIITSGIIITAGFFFLITMLFSSNGAKANLKKAESLSSQKSSSLYTSTNSYDDGSSLVEESSEAEEVTSLELQSSTASSAPKSKQPVGSNTNSSVSSPENNTGISKEDYAKRPQLNDVSNKIWGGYIYYISENKWICKKKIDGDEPEIQVSSSIANTFQVINDTIYFSYNYNNIIAKMDTDGNNLQIIDSHSNVSVLYVAGKWIIGKEHGTGKLYMIKTDGSKKVLLSTRAEYVNSTFNAVLGFDRGYCYYYAADDYLYGAGYSQDMVFNRFDYRSDDPKLENVRSLFDISVPPYDRCQVLNGKIFIPSNASSISVMNIVSESKSTISTILSPQSAYRFMGLNDYFSYLGDQKGDSVAFTNIHNGQTAVYKVGEGMTLYEYCRDIETNTVYFQHPHSGNRKADLLSISADGSVKQICTYSYSG